MKKYLAVCLLICTLLLQACTTVKSDVDADCSQTDRDAETETFTEAPTETPTEAETEPEEPTPSLSLEGVADTVRIWSMNALPFTTLNASNERTSAQTTGVWQSRSGCTKMNEAWSWQCADKGGLLDSACLAVTQKSKDWRYDTLLYFPEDVETAWYGVDEVWIWLDLLSAEFLSGQVVFDLNLIDGDGDVFSLSKDKEETKARGCVYLQNGDGWIAQTLNAWGHNVLPSAFCGFIRIPVTAENYYNAGGKTLNLANVLGIAVYFENYVDTKGTFYIDELRVHIDEEKRKEAMKIDENVLTLDLTKTHQTFEYFGGSGCWVGEVSKYLTSAQLKACTALLYNRETGIGLTSYRYNIGAGGPMNTGSATVKNTQSIEVSPGVYDLSRDADAIDVMERAISEGCDCVTLFVNSPPARMTVSGYTCGEMDFGACNLRDDCVDDFVTYVVDITELFVKAGYPVKYVSPINEPSNHWGDVTVNQWQEGCYYSPEQVVAIDLLVAQELQKRQLAVRVAFPEIAGWSQSTYATTLAEMLSDNADLLALVDHFCGHSYNVDDTVRADFLAVYQNEPTLSGLPLRQTEWCSGTTGISGAVELSEIIHGDLTVFNVVSWEFWVNLMTDDYSLIRVEDGAYTVSKRLYALGNYAKFIQGATRVDASVTGEGDLLVSAYRNDTKGETYVIVTNRSDKNASLTLDGAIAEVYQTSAQNNLADLGTVDLSTGAVLPCRSVTTFVIKD